MSFDPNKFQTDEEMRAALIDAGRRAQAATRSLAEKAREDPVLFAAYVLRDEETGRPTIPSTAQVEWHDLLSKFPRVIIWSHFEAGKTNQIAIARVLWELGRNPALRIAILSNTQGMAEKTVGAIEKYIERSPELRQVFPNLVPGDLWTSTKFTVKRQTISRVPSVQALGVHGNFQGDRLDLVICDDILDFENTLTQHAREDLWNWYHASVPGRLTANARVWFIGNAFHPQDILHRLADMPIWVWRRFPVIDEAGQPTWPERWPLPRIAWAREEFGPLEFARKMLCKARDESSARFQESWIKLCMARGDGRDIHLRLVDPQGNVLARPSAGFKTVTGVDLAVQQNDKSDVTAIFTIAVHPDQTREVLCIEAGKWTGPDIVGRIEDTHNRYSSLIIVENNAAQDYIVQFTRHGSAVPVRAFTTGRNKAHPDFGIESIGVEMSNGKWIIPNRKGVLHPEVRLWIDDMLFYSPLAHTGDRLMASWLAREGVRMSALKAEVGKNTWRAR